MFFFVAETKSISLFFDRWNIVKDTFVPADNSDV